MGRHACIEQFLEVQVLVGERPPLDAGLDRQLEDAEAPARSQRGPGEKAVHRGEDRRVLVATATAEGGAVAARALAVAVRDLLPAERPGVVAVGSETSGGKAVVVAAVNSTARTAGQDASVLVKRLLRGRGGGSAEVAQGGGLSPGQLTETLSTVPGLVGGT